SSQAHNEQARQAGAVYEAVAIDLSRVDHLEEQMEEIVSSVDITSLESAVLINNAGVLSPTGPIEKATSRDIANHVEVNLTAPIILSSAFIRITENWEIPKTILNISSGAGRKPYSGWSCYCATKAGLDHFTR